ncbi:ECF transporter S component [Alkaliphilus pronyensis]|uniref:ECF transporter S component n=1 Tax=Alkaliphilus pronyensis TaxID=1482732 RepID=A0A6I0F8N3_9FIRM|nr:ECF transporter S component [Alkaliphilus pronyensis]KAB3531638.1 ECF transporter S component [Alkaliphilus pronyensis]
MRNESLQNLTIIGLLTALIAVSTMIITIPIPATEGFIHLGDSMIFLAAILFGSKKAGLSAGIGSAMADVLLGYTHWALPTLIIKGLMGYGVGVIANQENDNILNTRNIIALTFGALCMVTGYFFTGAALKGSFAVALASVPANLIQGFGGAILFLPLGIALKRTKIIDKYAIKQ